MLVYPSASIYTFRPRNVKMNITFTIYNLNVLIFSICVQYLVLSLYRAIRFENYGTAFDTFLIQNLLFFFLFVYVCIMIALFILEKRTEENQKQNNEALDQDANLYPGTVPFPANQQSQVTNPFQYTQIPQTYETLNQYPPQMMYVPTQPNPTTASAPKKNSLPLLINSTVKSSKIALLATMTLLLHSVLGCWTLDYSLDVCVFTWNGNVRLYFGVFYILMLLSGLISLQVIDVDPLTSESRNLRSATVYFLFACTVLVLHRSYIQKIDEVCLYKKLVGGIPEYDAAQSQEATCNGFNSATVSIFTADERLKHSTYTPCRISDISQIEVAAYNVLFIGSIVVNLILDCIVFVPQVQIIASIIRTIFYILAFVYTVNYISTPKSRIPEVPLFLIFAFGVVRELVNVFSPQKMKVKDM